MTFNTALCRHVYLPCWAETGQLLSTWFSVSLAPQFGQVSEGVIPQRNMLALVGKHLTRALLAKFAMFGFIRVRCLDQVVSSVAIRADRRALNNIDWTFKLSNFSRRVLSWAVLEFSSSSFFERVWTSSLKEGLGRDAILGSLE